MKDKIKSNLDNILTNIEGAKVAAGRTDAVVLVGVSKFQSLDKMRIAYDLGLLEFGENYVQEGVSKVHEFSAQNLKARFHFIGSLQTNKVKDAVANFNLIQTIDSKKLVEASVKAVRSLGKEKQDILLQVNVSKEGQKSGVSKDECSELLAYALSQEEVNVLGLMAIGSFTDDLSVKLSEFRLLAGLRGSLETEFACALPQLSMGMSDDYQIAIQEGASIVRIGSLLFGERDSK